MSSEMRKERDDPASGSKGRTLSRFIPVALVSICALYALSKLRPPSHDGDFDLTTFGQLPVQKNGRVKPLDTVARNALLVMRGKQSVPDGPEASYFEKLFYGKKSPRYLTAIEWFAELTLRPSKADKYKVFRIDHPEVLGLFGFAPGKAKYFSFNDLFHSTDIENLRKKQDKILKEVNYHVSVNPDASEKDEEEMRDRLISQYEEAQDKLDSLMAKVTEIERAIRSIKLGEDLNRNNQIDDGEDLNQNGKLDPGPDSKKYTPYQRNLGHLYDAVTLYDQLKNSLFPHAGVHLLGYSYSKEIEALSFHKEISDGAIEKLREELLASGALENESKLMEILSKKPKAMELIQADQSLKASKPFLRGKDRIIFSYPLSGACMGASPNGPLHSKFWDATLLPVRGCDPALGGIIVEEQGAGALPVEIQPSALRIIIEEGIDSLVRPEPAHFALPKPQSGRRALHREYPTELFVSGPAIRIEVEITEPATRPPIGGRSRLGVDPAWGGRTGWGREALDRTE